MNKDFDEIISLIAAEKLNISETNELLIRAIRENKIDAFRKLLEPVLERSDAREILNYKSDSPLIIEVVKSGHDGILRNLIEAGIDLNVGDFNDNNAMHFAVKKGKMESFKILYETNPKLILNTNKSTENILDIAAQKRSAHFVQRLGEIIGKENMVKLFSDEFGFHRFHILITDGDTEVIKTIFQICTSVIGFSLVVKSIHHEFGAPIQASIKAERIEVVKAFLDYYPNLGMFIASNGKNNFHVAVETGSKEFVNEILKLYQEKLGEDQIKELLKLRDNENLTPIEKSVINGTESILKLLLQYGEIKLVNKNGNNLLHLAVLLNHPNCCFELLKCPKAQDLLIEKNNDGFIPLELAAAKLCHENGDSGVLEQLVGSMISAANNFHSELETHLLLKVVKEQLKIVVQNDVRVLGNVLRKNKNLPKMQEIYEEIKDEMEQGDFELNLNVKIG